MAGTSTFTQSYTYDLVNRLASVKDTGGWSQNFSFDSFGNVWDSTTGLPTNNQRPTSNIYNAKNQMSTGTYDAAGNLLSVASIPGRITLDPSGSRIISAGYMQSRNVATESHPAGSRQ